MTYAWHDAGDGRQVYRKVRERRGEQPSFPRPMLLKPFDEPVQSMADGRFYSSKTALSRSYRAAHNPRGEDFTELGHEDFKTREVAPDPAQRRDHIRQAMNDVLTGNLPPEIAAVE